GASRGCCSRTSTATATATRASRACSAGPSTTTSTTTARWTPASRGPPRTARPTTSWATSGQARTCSGRSCGPAGHRRHHRGGVFSVTVNSNQTVSGLDFGNQSGRVTGAPFQDVNGNGARDPGELSLAGWVIYDDRNNNGVLDSGEPSVLTDAA